MILIGKNWECILAERARHTKIKQCKLNKVYRIIRILRIIGYFTKKVQINSKHTNTRLYTLASDKHTQKYIAVKVKEECGR